MAGSSYQLTVKFDSGIEKVQMSYGSYTYTFSTSGEFCIFHLKPGNEMNLNVTLKDSYNLASSTLGAINGNTITIPESEISSYMVCTITSQEATPTYPKINSFAYHGKQINNISGKPIRYVHYKGNTYEMVYATFIDPTVSNGNITIVQAYGATQNGSNLVIE